MIKEGNPIVDKTIQFSLDIIIFCEILNKSGFHSFSNQIIRSGTSIGANVAEAQNAESKKDFIHKIKIATKELEEIKYWLTLCKKSDALPFNEELEKQIIEIGLILYKILSTSKTVQIKK